MTEAQAILEELHAELGAAEASLVRAEGETPAARVQFRHLAVDSLNTARLRIEQVTKLVERELYEHRH